jgi:hypothetical protein
VSSVRSRSVDNWSKNSHCHIVLLTLD